jgi:HK97 family phage major capsid protein
MPQMDDELKEIGGQLKELVKKQGEADSARNATIEELKAEVQKKFGTVGDVQDKLNKIVAENVENLKTIQELKAAAEDLTKKMNRPEFNVGTGVSEQKKMAVDYARIIHNLKHPNLSTDTRFDESRVDTDGIILANNAVKKMLRATHGSDIRNILSVEEHKALTTFAFSNNSFIVSPEMSNIILSSLTDVTDVSGLFFSTTISKPSIRFLVDNVRLQMAAWACETDSFANNPKPFLDKGLGEVEIKADLLRYSLVASRELLEDADVDIEAWMQRKISDAYRRALSQAFMTGDGNQRPIGILNPAAGLPIIDVAATTVSGAFTWQDLIQLKYNVPIQYHGADASYLLNQYSLADLLTMTDGIGRPIMISSPADDGTMMVNGSKIMIVTQMPNVGVGNTAIAFGNWKETYTVVNRKAVTFQRDDYSAGFAILYKFEARVGGGVTNPNASRLLRIN